MIKRIEKEHLPLYCPYCKKDGKKVSAVWRLVGWYNLSIHISCDKHKDKLGIFNNNYYSEADRQTWMRI